MDSKIEALKKILVVIDESTSHDDLVKAFESALFQILKIEYGTEKEIASLQKTYEEALTLIKDDTKLQELKKQFESAIKGIELLKGDKGEDGKTPTKNELVDLIYPLIPDPVSGKKGDKGDKGIDGHDGEDGESIIGPAGKDGKDGSPDSGEQIAEKLNSTEESVDIKVIKGLDDFQKLMKEEKKVRFVGGARGINLYIDGAKKGLINYLNLIAGTGVTLTYNRSSGRNDVTITSSGSGGGILAATGTVDGSNLVFTFISAPSIIIVDGVPKQKTQSDTTANWTGTTSVTLTVAPVSDIYGIA
jgi:hypothetical protein